MVSTLTAGSAPGLSGILGRAEILQATLEVFTAEHYPPSAFAALETDVRAHADDFPLKATARVLLPHLRDVPHPYAHGGHSPALFLR